MQPVLVSREAVIAQSKIIIIEDNRFERIILRQVLEQSGFVHIEEAENGIDGLNKIFDNPPDLIVLDIEMPVMDGIEFCKKINQYPELKHIPIIAQTGRTKSEDKEQIFDAGASDYVAKPIDKREFIARIFSHLERSQWLSQLTQFHERIKDELAMAMQTQQVLIPSEQTINDVEKAYQIKVRHHELTCSELGGDFWGTFQLSADKLVVYIIDFSGHGINAALNTFRLHTLMQQMFMQFDDPGEFMSQLNKKLASLLPTGQFATMFYGIIDTQRQQLNYATASCPAPIIFRDGGEVEIIDGSGFLFGTIANIQYKTQTTKFMPGDMLFLYSDALTESPDFSGNIIDEKQIINFIKPDYYLGYDNLLDLLKNNYSTTWPDDLTINGYYFLK